MNKRIVKQWTTEAGLQAWIVLVRNSHHCGYVEVPPSLKHIDFEMEDIEVHGGITYTGAPDWADNKDIIGYDCAHSGDATLDYSFEGDVWRDEEYCTEQCESLAKQIVNMELTTK